MPKKHKFTKGSSSSTGDPEFMSLFGPPTGYQPRQEMKQEMKKELPPGVFTIEDMQKRVTKTEKSIEDCEVYSLDKIRDMSKVSNVLPNGELNSLHLGQLIETLYNYTDIVFQYKGWAERLQQLQESYKYHLTNLRNSLAQTNAEIEETSKTEVKRDGRSRKRKFDFDGPLTKLYEKQFDLNSSIRKLSSKKTDLEGSINELWQVVSDFKQYCLNFIKFYRAYDKQFKPFLTKLTAPMLEWFYIWRDHHHDAGRYPTPLTKSARVVWDDWEARKLESKQYPSRIMPTDTLELHEIIPCLKRAEDKVNVIAPQVNLVLTEIDTLLRAATFSNNMGALDRALFSNLMGKMSVATSLIYNLRCVNQQYKKAAASLKYHHKTRDPLNRSLDAAKSKMLSLLESVEECVDNLSQDVRSFETSCKDMVRLVEQNSAKFSLLIKELPKVQQDWYSIWRESYYGNPHDSLEISFGLVSSQMQIVPTVSSSAMS